MNEVEHILINNIDNHASLFIFPTTTSSSGWADHLLRIKGTTVPMKKFIAWDEFKRDSIRSTVQNKKSIPSALRKIFVSRLIKENADLVSQSKNKIDASPLFSSIIKPEYALNAGRFTPWLAKILPELNIWFKKTLNITVQQLFGGKLAQVSAQADKLIGDDKDMFVLACRYAKFLEEYNLFEPAWETPPFKDEGKECFVFFPESLADFSEYRELLESSPHVKIISLQDINVPDAGKSETFFYSNSRREITEAALYIRSLHEKENIAWENIAVCIQDTENYEPYVLREFTNRNIPYVKRTSKTLTDYSAGRLFRSVLDCVSQDFSFSSLTELVLNKSLPWLDTEHIDNIIDFGIVNNCLYSWTEITDKEENKQYINVWEDAFKKPLGGINPESRKYFEKLKKHLQTLRASGTFAELRRQYFAFRSSFLDMSRCSQEADLVLSRCISELMELVELEKNFPHVPAADPFAFFTEYLSEVSYLPQQETSGVSILPYKTAAAAPFDCHIVLGASQESMTIVNTHLDFLTRKKRESLGIFDEDASMSFINLHKFNSVKKAAFFCSEQTFSGYTIPHSGIGAALKPQDSYKNELESSEKQQQSPQELHEYQYNGFMEWKNRQPPTTYPSNNSSKNKNETSNLYKTVINNITSKLSDKPAISATALQSYYQCSLIWLFERVLKLENVQIEASLMAENISGMLFHEILHRFLTEIKNSEQPLVEPERTKSGYALVAAYKNILKKNIDSIFNNFPIKTSSLTEKLLKAGSDSFRQHLENCLIQFLKYFAGKKVFGTEISYKAEKNKYYLVGKADCILKDDSDPTLSKYIIIDFKMKHLPKTKECNGQDENGLLNFQLPMYIKLAEEKENIKVYTALFYSILDAKANVLIGIIQDIITEKLVPYRKEDRIECDDEQYQNIFREFDSKVEQFRQETSCGKFTVYEKDRNNCHSCNYSRICRTTYIINRGSNYGT